MAEMLFPVCRAGQHASCPGQSGSVKPTAGGKQSAASRPRWVCTCECHQKPPEEPPE